MSALPSIHAGAPSPLPGRREPREVPRRHLDALPRPQLRRAPRVTHGVVALAGLGAIILAQLGVSIALSDGAYEITALESSSAQLSRDQQSLQERLDVLASPQQVALSAEGLGMVQGQASQFLRLSDGVVLGGPDALHMQQPSTTTDGGLLVGNELVQQADAAPTPAPVDEPEPEPEPYPGMLLPAEGVATQVGG